MLTKTNKLIFIDKKKIIYTCSLGECTPTNFTMFLDIINKFLVFLFGPSSFVQFFDITTRLPHSFYLCLDFLSNLKGYKPQLQKRKNLGGDDIYNKQVLERKKEKKERDVEDTREEWEGL